MIRRFLTPTLLTLLFAPAARAQAPAWTHGGTCYEVFVRSFQDSNGDGIGDLNGLIRKLDYINDGNPRSRTSLGASCIWLMPVMASPSYHGYDVSDYYRVEPAYGTNDDFKRLVAAAHRRGIRILIDLVLNHTSNQHPDFLAALHDTTSPYRSWYRFSPTKLGPGPWGDTNTWRHSPVRDEYYYGPFSSSMPDLDYHTRAVREEAKKIAAFWIQEMGADGFRLDAIPYLVEDGSCQMGCPGTHAVLAEWAAYLRGIAPEAWTVGEVWGRLDDIMPYYPDQLTSYFDFEIADSLIHAVRRGTPGGMLSGYLRLQDTLPAYRYSPFLSNHDGTRVMTLLGGDMARMREAATLLLTLPGTPFVYYGEEIGMVGDKPDPRLRTPMQWAPSGGYGFTTGTPWEPAQPDSLTATVTAQEKGPGSLLNLYRRLIHLRAQNEALASGTLIPLGFPNPLVGYIRATAGSKVLVLANLGDSTVSPLASWVRGGTLALGTYRTRNLLGPAEVRPLSVTGSAEMQSWQLRGLLAPHQVLVLQVEP